MHEKWNFLSSCVHVAQCFMLPNVDHIIKNKSQNVTLAICLLLDEGFQAV